MKLTLETDVDLLNKKFYSLKSGKDIADLLEIEYKSLVYYLYVASPEKNYKTFTIKKASGDDRQILAPISPIKILQRKLVDILYTVYSPKAPIHGFTPGRSILTNAQVHSRKANLLNVDLKDFFPSINFGRVRGLFLSPPYNLHPSAATILAQLCCVNNQLPQGAPTSPIISNMICSSLDSQLRILAKENRCFYTRYADDLTFSTTVKNFPGNIASILPNGETVVGNDLLEIIQKNGFEINYEKVRLQTQYQRQEVTGLTTNLFPNVKRNFVRQIRAMLHDWETNGYEVAQKKHFDKYRSECRSPYKTSFSFSNVVKGKIDFIGMVKGKSDPIYLKFIYRFASLNPDYEIPANLAISKFKETISAILFTEGKTDWKHIKTALERFHEKGKYSNLIIEFNETEDDIGGDNLAHSCEVYSKNPKDHRTPCIFLFDRDVKRTLKTAKVDRKDWHDWGKNVYSVKLPVPNHRKQTPNICIELLYKNRDLFTKDKFGKRLFLSDEFDTTGIHLSKNLFYKYAPKLDKNDIFLIDDAVYNSDRVNVALPKSNFADYVVNRIEGFEDFDVSGFEALFDLIEKIIS